MIQPIAHEILYKAYLHERETYIKKELENPSFVMVKESEEGRLYQVLPTEEELRSRFRPYRFDLSLALLEQLDVSYFLYSKKEEILPLIGLEIYSSVLNSIWDIKHLQANEFFKRLINKEASPKKIAESVYRVFREKFPDQEIETVQYMCSWGAVDKDLSWLQALPIFQSWREKILFERENKT